MRILLVEDEKAMAEVVAQVLKTHHYTVDLAFDGEYGLDCALSGIYDTIILDIMLPKRDGLSMLRQLRAQGVDTPVILLTAKGEIEDKIKGLDSGADDYLAKPFQTGELLARLRALGRRGGEFIPNNVLCWGDIELEPLALNLRGQHKSFKLTLKECQLLELLIRHKGAPVSKESMIEKVWGYNTEAADGNVEVYISFLRKKLGQMQSGVTIQTVRGIGYRLAVRDAS